jgi:hypothetical protein
MVLLPEERSGLGRGGVIVRPRPVHYRLASDVSVTRFTAFFAGPRIFCGARLTGADPKLVCGAQDELLPPAFAGVAMTRSGFGGRVVFKNSEAGAGH